HQAKRVLKERGAKDVLPALAAWVKKLDPKEPDYEHHLLESLWTYQSLDVVEPKLLATLLQARDHHARAAATRAIQTWHPRLPNAMELLAERVADDHPQVRLEAVRALGQLGTARAAEVAMTALDRPMDKFLDYALWLTARDLQPQWLPALQNGTLDFGGNTARLVFALQAAGSGGGSNAALKTLLDLLKGGKVAKDREESVLSLIAALGGPGELSMVLDRVLAKEGNSAARQTSLLAALELATRQRTVRPAGDLARVGDLLASESEAVRAAAARIAGLWQVEALRPRLLELARAAKTSETVRQAVMDGLVLLGGQASQEVLAELTAAERPFAVRRMAVIALASSSPETAAKVA